MFCVADSLEKAGDLEKSGKEHFCAKNLEIGIWSNSKNPHILSKYFSIEKIKLEKPKEKCTFETWKWNLDPLVGRPPCISRFFIN